MIRLYPTHILSISSPRKLLVPWRIISILTVFFFQADEQSQVLTETLPPYNDPFPVPATSWQQMPTWHPQAPQLTVDGTGVMSVSPTWSGDHDYTLEAAVSDGVRAQSEWSAGDEFTVKSEPGSYYDDEDEEDDPDEDSSERARAASERDEVRARQLNLPFTAAEIVMMGQSEYVGLTRSKGRFTREQIELIKEIRRHGGNKEAARRSRQKKVEMSRKLEDEVKALERERNAMMVEYKKALREIELEEKAIEQLKKNMRK